MNYFATREGVEILVDGHKNFPATKKQQAYIKRLIRTFPDAAELLEYDDYRDQPTRERANEFIRQVRESFVERGLLEIYRFVPPPLLETFDPETIDDVDEFLGWVAKARFMQELEEGIVTRAIVRAFPE